MINAELHILLIERDDYPFKGLLSLPGGFIQVNQDLSHGEYLDETAAYFALIPPDLNRMIELNADLSDQWIPI
jgi:hypothetical protein